MILLSVEMSGTIVVDKEVNYMCEGSQAIHGHHITKVGAKVL